MARRRNWGVELFFVGTIAMGRRGELARCRARMEQEFEGREPTAGVGWGLPKKEQPSATHCARKKG